jgi:type I restriction enzyme R subunit
MIFNEANTVEAFIRDRLAGSAGLAAVAPGLTRQGGAISGLGWNFVGHADLLYLLQKACF